MDFENVNQNICFCRRCRGIVYVVKKGDTLYSIANRFGVTVNDILNANRYINIYNLQIGDKLCVPVMPPRPRTTDENGMMIDYTDDGAFEQNEIEKEDISSYTNGNAMNEIDSNIFSADKIKDVINNYDMNVEEFVNYLKKFDK